VSDRTEGVDCPLCSSSERKSKYQVQGFTIADCVQCGLAYVSPRLTEAALREEYNTQRASGTPYYLSTFREDVTTCDRRMALVERFRGAGDLLDLGCGPGTLLKAADTRGWKGVGVDLNDTSAAYARSHGLQVHTGRFPHPELEGHTFDAVVMSDFIEHVPDPLDVLVRVRELLRPGGVTFLSTPDAGSLVARLMGRRWLHMKPREHLTYFNRATLRRLLETAGFEVLWMKALGRRRSLKVVCDRVARYNSHASKIAKWALPEGFCERTVVRINLGDEVGVIARPMLR
jgi:2-polyprenyl-3-methyl-5-hydroxy-6-metoxy-1,4-benzoquinol methylase